MRGYFEADLLHTLVAIVETGSFTAAAERIHRTQQAVSMQMRRLEELAGKPIFDRSGRQVRLTPVGDTVLAYARRILDLQREAFSALDTRNAAILRLGAPDQYVGSLLPIVVSRFVAEHPDSEIIIRCEPSSVLRDLVGAGELDLALVTRQAGWSDIEIVRRERLVWASGSGYRVQADGPVPLALFPHGSMSREFAISALAAAGRAYRVTFSSLTLAALMPVLRAGLAVGVVAECSLPPDLRVIGPADGFPQLPDVELGLVHSAAAGRNRPLVSALRHRVVPDGPSLRTGAVERTV